MSDEKYKQKYVDAFQQACKNMGFEEDNRFVFFSTREYSIPLYIGCMVRVTYYAVFGSAYELRICAIMSALSNNNPISSQRNAENIALHQEDIYYEFESESELKQTLEFYINAMFEKVELQLKNVLGLERIA